MSYEMIALLMFGSMMALMLSGQRVFAAVGAVASAAALLLYGNSAAELPLWLDIRTCSRGLSKLQQLVFCVRLIRSHQASGSGMKKGPRRGGLRTSVEATFKTPSCRVLTRRSGRPWPTEEHPRALAGLNYGTRWGCCRG